MLLTFCKRWRNFALSEEICEERGESDNDAASSKRNVPPSYLLPLLLSVDLVAAAHACDCRASSRACGVPAEGACIGTGGLDFYHLLKEKGVVLGHLGGLVVGKSLAGVARLWKAGGRLTRSENVSYIRGEE